MGNIKAVLPWTVFLFVVLLFGCNRGQETPALQNQNPIVEKLDIRKTKPLLSGKTRAEVQQLLGPPSRQSHHKDSTEDWWYDGKFLDSEGQVAIPSVRIDFNPKGEASAITW
jgi:hypothetical protein